MPSQTEKHLKMSHYILFSFLVESWEAVLAAFICFISHVKTVNISVPPERQSPPRMPVLRVAARSTSGGDGESTMLTGRDKMRELFGNFLGGEWGSFTCQIFKFVNFLGGDLIIKWWVIFFCFNCVSLIFLTWDCWDCKIVGCCNLKVHSCWDC